MLAGSRERLVRQRVQLANTIRGLAAEFGLVAPKGAAQVKPLLSSIAADEALPALAREEFAGLAADYAHVEARLEAVDGKLRAWHRASDVSQRLARVPGIGPVIASLLVMKVPDPKAFESGRDFAAWLGLTPKGVTAAQTGRTHGRNRPDAEICQPNPCSQGAVHTWIASQGLAMTIDG